MNPMPVKKNVGRPKKNPNLDESDKTRRNREAQNRFRNKQGEMINKVVDDLENCEDERTLLKNKVKGLTDMIQGCDNQVKEIMKAINAMPTKKKR